MIRKLYFPADNFNCFVFSAMIPRGIGKSYSYGRGQTPSYRGKGYNYANNNRQDMVLAQIGNRRLITSNIASSSNEVISNTDTGDIQINQNDP
ncbi:hypothetical protein Hanom_Chr09g00782151 [Helianthus anomalus]